jgi:hypothetical protein
MLDIIMDAPKIRKLGLAGNMISDEGLVEIFDGLELNHRFELEELNLRQNNLTNKASKRRHPLLS